MENRQQKILAFFLVTFLFVVYKQSVLDPFIYGPQEAQKRQVEDKTANVSKSNASNNENNGEVNSSFQLATEQKIAKVIELNRNPNDKEVVGEGLILISTSKKKLILSLLGGRFTSLFLNDYRKDLEESEDGAVKKLNMITHKDGDPFPLGIKSGDVDDRWVKYSLVNTPSNLTPKGDNRSINIEKETLLILKGDLPDGREITKSFTFYPEGYIVNLDVVLSEASSDASKLELYWTKYISENQESSITTYDPPGFSWFDGKKVNREQFSGLAPKNGDQSIETSTGAVKWISSGDKYFMSTLISAEGESLSSSISREDNLYYSKLGGSEIAGKFKIYTGPKSYEQLKKVGFDLQKNVNFGFSGILSAPLLALLHFFYGIFSNYGLAIVLLTIVVKFLLYPLNAVSYKQMKAMQELGPELKRIRENIKDKQQQQFEMMALYKKRGVNPLGGCFPVFLQMPIFLGLFTALNLDVELRHAPFALWITDLSAPEKLMIGDFGLPVMVILFVSSMILQQMIMPSGAEPSQKKMMMILPIVFGFLFVNFPAGLTLYYLTNNLISIAQMKALHGGKSNKTSLLITGGVSVAVFIFAFILTQIG